MDIQSLMTANPICCRPNQSLREVAQLMADNDCGQIPVVDEQRRPLGVITDRDIAVRAVAKGAEIASATASDFMTSPATTVREDGSVAQVAKCMEDQQIRRVVVVDDSGAVTGIVAQADIARSGNNLTAEVVKQVSQPSSQH
jgi:CBS domain-containing protein